MTTVCFRVNLGSMDAARLGIADFRVCLAGAEVQVEDAAAKALESAGVIEPLPPPKPVVKPVEKPVEMRADPVVVTPLVADPQPVVAAEVVPVPVPVPTPTPTPVPAPMADTTEKSKDKKTK